MAIVTFIPIQSYTLSSTQSSVVFSNVPQDYTDLVLITSMKYSSGGPSNDRLGFNGDSGGNYSNTIMYGTGSGYGGYRSSNATTGSLMNDTTSTEFNANIHHILNYTNSGNNKITVGRSSPVTSSTQVGHLLYRSTAPITSVTVTAGTSTFVIGSTFALYGIK